MLPFRVSKEMSPHLQCLGMIMPSPSTSCPSTVKLQRRQPAPRVDMRVGHDWSQPWDIPLAFPEASRSPSPILYGLSLPPAPDEAFVPVRPLEGLRRTDSDETLPLDNLDFVDFPPLWDHRSPSPRGSSDSDFDLERPISAPWQFRGMGYTGTRARAPTALWFSIHQSINVGSRKVERRNFFRF